MCFRDLDIDVKPDNPFANPRSVQDAVVRSTFVFAHSNHDRKELKTLSRRCQPATCQLDITLFSCKSLTLIGIITMSRASAFQSDAIFTSPENEAFQLSKPYRKLDSARKDIRLLRFVNEVSEGRLCFEMLQNLPLSDVRGTYTAISYCAGSPKESEVIFVDEVECNVFARLDHALRQTIEATPRRPIWCDQVCMNQADLRERARQVLLMRDIFEDAALVAVCMSDASSDDSGESLLWAARISSSLGANPDPISPVSEYVEKSSSIGLEHVIQKISSQRDPRVTEHLRDNLLDRNFLVHWARFFDIIVSPWSLRAWTCQEFVVASNACLMHTGICVPPESIRPVVQSLHMSTIDLLGRKTDDLLTRVLGHHYSLSEAELEPEETLEQRIVELFPVLEEIRRRLFTQPVLYGAAGLLGMYELIDTWRKSHGLTDVLLKSFWYSASDERDRIYAFQGLVDPLYTTIPDYSPENTFEKVLIEVTENIIFREDSLVVLGRAPLVGLDSRDSILPSWVVNWKALEFGVSVKGGLRLVEQIPEWASASAAFVKMDEVEGIKTPLALGVMGMHVDTVESVQDQAVVTREDNSLSNPPSSERDQTGSRTWHTVGEEIWLIRGSDHPWVLLREVHPRRDFHRIVSLAYFTNKASLTWDLDKLAQLVII